MYCFKCGSEIEDGSRFCNICGTSQPSSSSQTNLNAGIKEKFLFRIPLSVHFSSLNLGVYITWLLIHFIWIIVSKGSRGDFFPFSEDSDLNDYALPEFLLYTIFPIVVYIIIFLFASSKLSVVEKPNESNNLPLFNETTTPTLVGILTLITIILLRFGLEGEVLRISLSTIFIICIRILISIWVSRLAEKLNRKVSSWVLFGYLFPAFALLIINQKRKIN